MSKVYALLVVVLLAFTPSWLYAQQPQPVATLASPTAAPLAALPAATDTAAAIHRLFAAKRRLRTAVVAGTGLLYVIAVVSGPDKYGSYDGQFVRIFNYSPFLLGAVIGEFAYYGRYSHLRERRALDDWQAHRLSPEVRRRLAPRHFMPPASTLP
jgi:hypothetical protein